jgi:hypothetical protein
MDDTDLPQPDDPLYLNSRREALLILVAWAVCLMWTVTYCYCFGYYVAGEAIVMTLGMPSWVFWGVLVPWFLATVFSIWFGLCYMADDDLGETVAEANRGGDDRD